VRLTEHLVVEDDLGVRTQHHGGRIAEHAQQAGTGFFTGDSTHIVLGRFARFAMLRDIDVEHVERQAEAAQQFVAAGGFRGEVKHRRKHNPR